ncbi:aminodeoxychorismate synthase component I [Rothia sp. ZJ1223]|uniref:aminodeoxychorismate synthase component I n=1 Tax=Rothia sp. ZJ1223 TaxID=2811098 RepID=UPI001956297D|nr:aminodeoxychorismate synthase component I [Rothia sp. ZJ1223]
MTTAPHTCPEPLTVRPLITSLSVAEIYRTISANSDYSFWLDSAREESPMSRFSYLGVVPQGTEPLICTDARTADSFATDLEAALANAPQPHDVPSALTEALLGGYVGYFGYEYRALTEPASSVRHRASTPDALWIPAIRYIIHVHATEENWLIGDEQWCDEMESHLASTENRDSAASLLTGLTFTPPTRARYTAAVQECQREIFEGNSYEVCLTAQTRARASAPVSKENALATYLAQRDHNAAPYAAFMHCKDFFILSSSPERFLSISTDRVSETKPIKGTIARATDSVEDAARAHWLTTDAKTRAENLMIVDLLRNDLSRVSYPETVQVPVLMGVESYSTVHQLVSTVRSRLRADVSSVGAVQACFPGGSMTGAPKPSTMDIIDRLEGRARGIYSGALGFFSASGAANLSIVIRTLVVSASGEVSLSAGGAIVADSDPDAEYEEMLTKLRAALPPSVGGLG